MRTPPLITSHHACPLSRAGALFAASVFVAACKPEGDPAPPPAATTSAVTTSAASTSASPRSTPIPSMPAPNPSVPGSPHASEPASPSGSASASEDDGTASLQILKLVFTSNIRDKEPADKLDAAKPGQRVYAHVTFRNRTGSSREVDLVFRVNGKERSRVPLEVASSWSYRTWGYVTLRPADTSGEVTVTIVDDAGEEIKAARVPIRP